MFSNMSSIKFRAHRSNLEALSLNTQRGDFWINTEARNGWFDQLIHVLSLSTSATLSMTVVRRRPCGDQWWSEWGSGSTPERCPENPAWCRRSFPYQSMDLPRLSLQLMVKIGEMHSSLTLAKHPESTVKCLESLPLFGGAHIGVLTMIGGWIHIIHIHYIW